MENQTPPTPTTILDATGRVAVDLACVNCRYNLRTQPVDGKCPECGHPVTETTAGDLPILDREGCVVDDLPCVNCGYNLRTLPATGLCPECAAQVALSARGHYLRVASPRWVKRLANGALALIIALACAVALPLGGLIGAFIIGLVAGPQATGKDAEWWLWGALAIALGVICLWLFVRGLLQLTTPEPGAKFRGEGFSARKLVRYGILAVLALMLIAALSNGLSSRVFGPPFPAVAIITILTAAAGLLLPLALLRHIIVLMRRIPRPGLVTFARIEFWGGLVSGIVYAGSHVLLMIVSFSAFAPLAGGAGTPMTPYAGGLGTPTTVPAASARALSSLGYTSTTVTYVGPGGVTTTASMPASMPMAFGPAAFSPLFFFATAVTMAAGCGTLIAGIAGLVLLILVWRALANAARLAEQNAPPNTT